jgi:hypothetical protein
MAEKIVFYEGKRPVYRLGYPYVISTVRDIGPVVYEAEVYVLLHSLPSPGEFTLLASQPIEFAPSDDVQHLIPNPEAFLMGEALGVANGILHRRQFELYEQSRDPAALTQCELTAADWKQEILRLRYRGLSERIIDQIASVTHCESLRSHLRELRTKKPIVIRDAGIPNDL